MAKQPCKKPILVLDLDNTLLHTGDDMVPVKRPGLLRFLSNVRQRYELFIFTFGTRPYALDACKRLHICPFFVKPNRIFSREDAPYDKTGRHHVKAFEVFLCNGCAGRSVAVDDSPEVWAAETFEWDPLGPTGGPGPSAHQVVRIPPFVHNEEEGDEHDTYLDTLGALLLQKSTVKHILAQGAS